MNPYLLAERRQSRARAAHLGIGGYVGDLAPAAAAAAAGLLVPASFFAPGRDVGAGLADIYTRVGLLLAAGVALVAYQLVVRGPDRGVVDLHPVVARPWYLGRVWAVARATAPWLLASVAFQSPLLVEPAWFLGGVVVVGLGWAVAVAVGVGVNVAAPAIGLDPRWAGVLDAARGPNPRLQAALLYAPGVALAIAGLGAVAAARGVVGAAAGGPEAALLFVPVGLAAGALRFGMGRAAEVGRYPAILGEIEAAWAAAEAAEEAHHVYLDWSVRLAPAGLRRHLLRELRHVWRSQRGWVLGAWGFALLAALDAWSGSGRMAVVGVAVVGLAGARLGPEEPEWLEAWLGLGPLTIGTARALAVWLHLQVVVSGALVGLVAGHVGPLGVAALAALLVAVAASVAAGWGRRRAVALYLPAVLLIGGVLA